MACQPKLDVTSVSEGWAHQDSNLERAGYEPAALTVELWARTIVTKKRLQPERERAGLGPARTKMLVRGISISISQCIWGRTPNAALAHARDLVSGPPERCARDYVRPSRNAFSLRERDG